MLGGFERAGNHEILHIGKGSNEVSREDSPDRLFYSYTSYILVLEIIYGGKDDLRKKGEGVIVWSSEKRGAREGEKLPDSREELACY